MRRAIVVASLTVLVTAGCATAVTPDLVTREGYLASGPGLRLYETAAQRDAGSHQDCLQILRPEAAQTAPVPSGRVSVRGRQGQFDGDVMTLQIGGEHATHELCEARYILWAEITPIPET
jgi:hypothetical protein